MADAVVGARAGQKTPDGYYNVERMLKRVLAGNGKVLLVRHLHGRARPRRSRRHGRRAPQHDGRARRRDGGRRQGPGVLDAAHLSRLQRQHADRPRGRRRDAALPRRPFRQSVERALGRGRRQGRPRDGARAGGGAARLPRRRGRLHQRRQRGQQPCAQGRLLRPSRQGRSHHHHADRASGDHRAVPIPRAPGRARHLSAGRPHRPRRSRRPAPGDHAAHHPGQHHARQQRGRHHPADRGLRPHRPRARRPVSHRRGPVGRQDPDRRRSSSASICCRSPGTRSMRRRASAPCSCAAASRSSR